MKKKGIGALGIIFGLFMLLIIVLVVLGLFFKFAGQSGEEMQGVSEGFEKAQSKTDAISTCDDLCSKAKQTEDGKVNFCKEIVPIDWDGDDLVRGDTDPISTGEFDVCEEAIPCFVLIPDCYVDSVELLDSENCYDYVANSPASRDKYEKAFITTLNRTNCDMTGSKNDWLLPWNASSYSGSNFSIGATPFN